MSKSGESILRGARQALAYARGSREGFLARHALGPNRHPVRSTRSRTRTRAGGRGAK